MGKKVGKPKEWCLAPGERSMGCLGGRSEIRIITVENSIFQVKRVRKGQLDGRQNKTTKAGGETIKREPEPASGSEWRLVVRTVCEQSEPASKVCCQGEPAGSQGPLRLNTYLPTKP